MFLQIEYQPNIHKQRWYDMRSGDYNFHRNQIFGRRTEHLFIFGPKFDRLQESLSISTWMQWEGISV